MNSPSKKAISQLLNIKINKRKHNASKSLLHNHKSAPNLKLVSSQSGNLFTNEQLANFQKWNKDKTIVKFKRAKLAKENLEEEIYKEKKRIVSLRNQIIEEKKKQTRIKRLFKKYN